MMITIVNYAIFNASYIFSIRKGGNQQKAEIQAAVNKTTELRQIFREIFPFVLSADDMWEMCLILTFRSRESYAAEHSVEDSEKMDATHKKISRKFIVIHNFILNYDDDRRLTENQNFSAQVEVLNPKLSQINPPSTDIFDWSSQAPWHPFPLFECCLFRSNTLKTSHHQLSHFFELT